jgi:membrane protein
VTVAFIRGADDQSAPADDPSADERRSAGIAAHIGLPGQRAARRHGPHGPTDLGRHSWWQVLKRTVRQFDHDKLTTWAAALTYYGVLSLFPGLLVLVAALRLTGQNTTRRVLTNLTDTAPGPTQSILKSALDNLQHGQQSTAGVLAIVGIVGALWSASSYVGSFMQAANVIFDVPEGRPLWKKLPIRLGITIVTGLIVAVAALAVVFTGTLARQLGAVLHISSGVIRTFGIVKWPALLVVMGLLFSLLYWAAPNARQNGFRWITPGSALAVLIWAIASAGFAIYVANFGSYNKTYGSLAAAIIFLVWMWISNLAILIGAQFDSELQRERAIKLGHPADDEPYLPLRDTHDVDADDLEALDEESFEQGSPADGVGESDR